MKKKTCIVLLAALTWLNAYQIGDAAEDSAEAIQSSIQSTPLQNPRVSSPALPDDDDADLPLVLCQALVHGAISFYVAQPFFHDLIGISQPLESGKTLSHFRNLSPPQRVKERFFIPSARSLAPPLSAF